MDYKITEFEKDQRFDRFLRKILKENENISLWQIYKFIRKWQIKINQKKSTDSYRLQENDIVNIPDFIMEQTEQNKQDKLSAMPLETIQKMIIFEDENFIFFNKPAWVTIHEWNKHMKDLTMNSFLEKYVKETKIQESSTFSPAFCFRLDKDTSWILIAAKTYQSLKILNEMIRNRETNKTYIAISAWFWKNCIIDKKLEKVYDREFGKSKVIVSETWQKAESQIEILQEKKDENLWDISAIKVKLMSWRMHQIRVHLSWKKLPIIGDLMYWNPVINRLANKHHHISRQLLHSWKYSFDYDWKKYEVQAWIPEDFKKLFWQL